MGRIIGFGPRDEIKEESQEVVKDYFKPISAFRRLNENTK